MASDALDAERALEAHVASLRSRLARLNAATAASTTATASAAASAAPGGAPRPSTSAPATAPANAAEKLANEEDEAVVRRAMAAALRDAAGVGVGVGADADMDADEAGLVITARVRRLNALVSAAGVVPEQKTVHVPVDRATWEDLKREACAEFGADPSEFALVLDEDVGGEGQAHVLGAYGSSASSQAQTQSHADFGWGDDDTRGGATNANANTNAASGTTLMPFILSPNWITLRPGETVRASLVPLLPSRFPPQQQPQQTANANASATESTNAPATATTADQPTRNPAKQRSTLRRSIDALSYASVTIFLSFFLWALQNGNGNGNVPGLLERSLMRSLEAPYNSVRNGEPTIIRMNVDAATIDDVVEWVRGPLATTLVDPSLDSIAFAPPSTSTSTSTSKAKANDVPWWVTLAMAQNAWVAPSRGFVVASPLRFRQLRVLANASCAVDPRAEHTINACYAAYAFANSNTSLFGWPAPGAPGFTWASAVRLGPANNGAPSVSGRIATYDPSGFAIDVAGPSTLLSTFEALLANAWIDDASRVIMVEFTVGNPQALASVRLLGELGTSGMAYPSVSVRAFPIPAANAPSCASYSSCSALLGLDIISGLVLGFQALSTIVPHFSGPTKTENTLAAWLPALFDVSFLAVFLTMVGFTATAFSQAASVASKLGFGGGSGAAAPLPTSYVSVDPVVSTFLTATRLRATLVVIAAGRVVWVATPSSLARRAGVVTSAFVLVLATALSTPLLAAMLLLVDVVPPLRGKQVGLVTSAYSDFLVPDGPDVGWPRFVFLVLVAAVWMGVVPGAIALVMFVQSRVAPVAPRHSEDVPLSANAKGSLTAAASSSSFRIKALMDRAASSLRGIPSSL